MEKIKIRRILNFTGGSLDVKYEGTPTSDDCDLDKTLSLFDDFINNHDHNDMVKNIEITRTIFKKFQEKALFFYYETESQSECVKYDNYNLLLYEKIKREDNCHYYERYKIKYEPDKGIKLSYNNHENDITDCLGIELLSKEITGMMWQISRLKNTKTVVLNKENNELIEIYKLFYNDKPDFSDKDISIKIKTMMAILAEFDISLNEVGSVEDGIKLVEDTKKRIKIVGECIRETIQNEPNQNEALITISKIIHTGSSCLSYDSDIRKTSEFTDCTTDEVESSIKLVKHIVNKIHRHSM